MSAQLFAVVLFSILNMPHNHDGTPQNTDPKYRICGKWKSMAKNLVIDIYTENDQFKARMTWFSDTEGKPMDYWTDRHNPDPALRNRKILGMSILKNLKYHSDSQSWEDGLVYDSKHGKEWNASAYIDKKGLLQVRGYWHFKFIGRTLTFFRIK
jgi:uncharacterized protein (DUF2147 family)